jgi:Ca-activated chloride channel homolog
MRGLWLSAAALMFGLVGCQKADDEKTSSAQPDPGAFTVLAGSELREIEPLFMQAAKEAGVKLALSYGGTLDVVERINGGEKFDAILPASGAYPTLALTTKLLTREKLFYSRVALGVKAAKLQALGWDSKNPTWATVAQAAGEGQLRYAMTNPANSNTGMSALFAVASAVAGKTEDLTAQEIDRKVLTSFLSGQKITAGSSGWLAEAFLKSPADVDAMVNYESVILRINEKLKSEDQLTLVYPQDGVISADYPLMLLSGTKTEAYQKLVTAFKARPFQSQMASTAYLRPTLADVPVTSKLPSTSVVELSFPNKLEVIDAALSSYQSEWRKPATSIFVLDVSGSMSGLRLDNMKQAIKALAGGGPGLASQRYAQFQNRERVILLSFSSEVNPPVTINFEVQSMDVARRQVLSYADSLRAIGGTSIYSALLKAQELATLERRNHPDRLVSIVLFTDGVNNGSIDFGGFKQKMGGDSAVRIFPILFGEASNDEMSDLAQFSNGRLFDARKVSLPLVFKEIRGYQ